MSPARCLTLLVAAWLAACAPIATPTVRDAPVDPMPTTPSPPVSDLIVPYVPPASGEVARLVMRGTAASGQAYLVSVLADGEHCGEPQLVGSGNAAQHPPSTTLPAGAPVTLELASLAANDHRCMLRWTFTPEAGKAYLVRGSSYGSTCHGVLDDMSDPEHIHRAEGVVRRNPQGESRCLPIAQSRGIVVRAAAPEASGPDAVLDAGATSTALEGLIAP